MAAELTEVAAKRQRGNSGGGGFSAGGSGVGVGSAVQAVANAALARRGVERDSMAIGSKAQ